MLNSRIDDLKRKLRQLSGSSFVPLSTHSAVGGDGSRITTLASFVRVRSTGFYFYISEEFREDESPPRLHQFSYKLQADPSSDSPTLFRYELHPDFDDPDEPGMQPQSTAGADFSRNPHFHPDQVADTPLKHLHYPFRRGERNGLVFGLIYWLENDLVRRFY